MKPYSGIDDTHYNFEIYLALGYFLQGRRAFASVLFFFILHVEITFLKKTTSNESARKDFRNPQSFSLSRTLGYGNPFLCSVLLS